MRTFLDKLALLCALSALAGCGASHKELRARAVYDLQCPDANLTLRRLATHTMGVWGCGRYATYLKPCGSGAVCDWVMNTVSTERPGATYPPPGYYAPAPTPPPAAPPAADPAPR